jgi:hypothetical protein
MRNVIWIAALLVGVLVAGSASAQVFGAGAQSATRTSNKIGLWDTTSTVSSQFRLTSLFSSFGKALLPGGTHVNNTTRLSPSDPNYMQAFGFKKLYGPR